ncbi:aspartyl-phosphate phosphatase Spo0E family protein [Thermohalobacter berrensis]|uniref:aspartyl-phosphate phosphatase Spo0E family protein n=1 Tax=Thermohalobacter berrensis TaxID=99594 RepID=UPI000E71C7C4|nr:aspartyl-phosphate phosphatase Spo0E family protein [Thermohalobacter berrensis]
MGKSKAKRKVIEDQRDIMHEAISLGLSLTSHEVVEESQKLDILLNEYYGIYSKKN